MDLLLPFRQTFHFCSREGRWLISTCSPCQTVGNSWSEKKKWSIAVGEVQNDTSNSPSLSPKSYWSTSPTSEPSPWPLLPHSLTEAEAAEDSRSNSSLFRSDLLFPKGPFLKHSLEGPLKSFEIFVLCDRRIIIKKINYFNAVWNILQVSLRGEVNHKPL